MGLNFEGRLSSVSDRRATINGLPVLLTKNLNGELPYLNLTATASDGGNFSFDLQLNILLYDDLNITGGGTQDLAVSGDITEYVAGRTITKTGTSRVRFSGNVEATGAGYRAQAGTTHFEDSANLTGHLTVSNGATVEHDGTIVGNVSNSGEFRVAHSTAGTETVTIHLLPTLGDGDIDSRNSSSKGDQDSQILVGSVSNATGTQVERVQRAMFSFDLSAIPDGTPLSGATITLQFDGNDSISNNNISGDLELYELTEDPLFNEAGSENVDWVRRDAAGAANWSTPGGTLGTLVASVLNTNLPNPLTTTQGQAIQLDSLSALPSVIANNLTDDVISFVLMLPGEEADMAAMIGDRDLYRFGSNESSGTSPAVLSISYEALVDSVAHVTGDFSQDASGSLLFDLRSASDFDQLEIGGNFAVGGTLEVGLIGGFSPQSGDTFDLLDFDPRNVSGSFDSVDLPALAAGLAWDVSRLLVTGELEVVAAPNADFDGDSIVTGLDFLIWQRNNGEPGTLATGDANGDGLVDAADLAVWQAQYGTSPITATATVPEPSGLALLLLSFFTLSMRCGSRCSVE